MIRLRAWSTATAIGLPAVASSPVWAQASDYTYVKMSLTVPWTLYFVFLACVLIPFVIMIVLAWRGAAAAPPKPMETAPDMPADSPP